MPRYYFEFYDDKGVTIDDEGDELPGLNTARSVADSLLNIPGRLVMSPFRVRMHPHILRTPDDTR
jgi:uncharacterized protein DUF6894